MLIHWNFVYATLKSAGTTVAGNLTTWVFACMLCSKGMASKGIMKQCTVQYIVGQSPFMGLPNFLY